MQMLISKKMQEQLNEQIANELYSSNAYLAIAAYFDSMGLKVFAAKFFEQSEEERIHALKILRYLLDVGATPQVHAITASPKSFKNAKHAVQCSLDQEITVTKQIEALMTLAKSEKDYATESFLKWFIDEQVEEQAMVSDLLQLMEHAGEGNLLVVEERLLRMGITLPRPEEEPGS